MKSRPFASILFVLLGGLLATPLFASVSLWELSPGDRPYLDTTSSQRTVAYNPVTGNVYVASGAGGVPGRILILDAATGADLGELSMAGVDSGTDPMIEVAVASDGTIYASNITLDPVTNPYRIYRWLSESASPQLIYFGDPTDGTASIAVDARWGKNMALRGTKDAIEILVISAGELGALFTGSDWLTVTPISDLPGYRLERGLAWGDGDTFYANHSLSQRALHHFALDRATGATQLLEVYDALVFPHLIGPIMVDVERRVLGGIQVGAPGVRQYAVFYDLDNLSPTFPNTAFLSVPFTTRGDNATGYGGMAYGGGRAFAMNTRSGLVAVSLPAAQPGTRIAQVTQSGNNIDLLLRSRLPVQGVEFQLEGTPSLAPANWSPVGAEWVQPLLGGEALVRTPILAGDRYFYRMTAAPGAPTNLAEDFETGAPGWTSGGTNNSWEIGEPTSGPWSAVSGQNVAATNLSGDYAPNSNAWLRSPPVDLRSATQATLSFSEYLDVDDYLDYHGTVISILDAATLEELETLRATNVKNTSWQERSLPLGLPSLGRIVVVQFRLFSDEVNPRAGWYLDNVSLGGPLLLIPEHTTSLASVTVNGVVTPMSWPTAAKHPLTDLGQPAVAQVSARPTDPGALAAVEGVPHGPNDTVAVASEPGVRKHLDVDVVGRDGVTAESFSIEMVNVWELLPGDRPYLHALGNLERSIAYNPTTGNVYLSSSDISPGYNAARVMILDGATGAEVGQLSMNGVSLGVWELCDIDVAADGTIYAANLTLTPSDPATPFRIYRWLSESADPELIYSGDPTGGAVATGVNARWGKNFTVRGTKDAIEILVVTAGTYAGFFTGSDSLSLTLFTDLTGTRPERGVAFGAGDTFFRKHALSGDRELREFSFNRATGTTQQLRTFPTSVFSNRVGPIFVDLERGILGAIEVGNVGVQQFVQFYRLDSLSTTSLNVPYLSLPFSLRNNSRDGYGDITFGHGRAWALNTNNGILAIDLPDPE